MENDLGGTIQKWFLPRYGYRLGAKKNEHETRLEMRPPTYTKIFGNLRLNCVTSNQGECDQSESNVLKAKEGAKEADIVFNDKSLYSPLSV